MFLSIIIPVYNAEKYLPACLSSCVEQNLSPEDYEILCVNDGSSDRSAEILSDFQRRYSSLRVITKANGGVSAARNDGLAQAKGDYIWFIDADDFIAKNGLGDLKQILSEKELDRLQVPIYEFTDTLSPEEERAFAARQLAGNYPYGTTVVWGTLLRAETIRSLGLRFDDSMPYGEDTLFIQSFIAMTDRAQVLTGPAVYCYRRNSSSATARYSDRRTSSQARSSMEIACCYLKKYRQEQARNGAATENTANELMAYLRRSLAGIAQLPGPLRREHIRLLRERELFPFKQPKECTYTAKQCAREPSGTGKLRNLLRYYSIKPLCFRLSTIPYSLSRAKISASRRLRKSRLLSRLLDFKNQLLRRGK